MKNIFTALLLFLSLHLSGQLVPPQNDRELLVYPFQVTIIPLDTTHGIFLHLFKGTKEHGDILYRNNGDSLIEVPLPKEMEKKHIQYVSRTQITIFFCIKNRKKILYGYNINTGIFMSRPEIRGHDNEGPM